MSRSKSGLREGVGLKEMRHRVQEECMVSGERLS